MREGVSTDPWVLELSALTKRGTKSVPLLQLCRAKVAFVVLGNTLFSCWHVLLGVRECSSPLPGSEALWSDMFGKHQRGPNGARQDFSGRFLSSKMRGALRGEMAIHVSHAGASEEPFPSFTSRSSGNGHLELGCPTRPARVPMALQI